MKELAAAFSSIGIACSASSSDLDRPPSSPQYGLDPPRRLRHQARPASTGQDDCRPCFDCSSSRSAVCSLLTHYWSRVSCLGALSAL